MTETKKALVMLAMSGLLASGTAQATLVDRGNGMIYDSDLNITWLADANYAETNGDDTDGHMSWTAAKAWAANLVYGGYSDWRLPTTLQPDASCDHSYQGVSWGYNCSGSELGHLFYSELGGAYGSQTLFHNIQHAVYWSGTVDALQPGGAWSFNLHDGMQDTHVQRIDFFYAWAVRSGDVAAVPEPASGMLFGLALAGLAVLRRLPLGTS